MAIVLESETFDGINSGGLTITGTKPSGTTTGDVLVALVAGNGQSTAPEPTDWVPDTATLTYRSRSGTSGSDAALNLYYLKVTGAHAGITDWTWTFTQNMRRSIWIGRLSGVHADVLDGTPITASQNSGSTPSTTPVSAAYTTNFANSLLFAAVAGNESVGSSSTYTFTAPSGYTEVNDNNTNSGDGSTVSNAVATQARPTAGSVSAGTWTITDSMRWASMVFALKDAGGSAGNQAPTVAAGADVFNHPASTELTRTATVADSDGTIVSTVWTVQSGPAEVGNTIESDASLSWTPTTAGTYVLRCTATDDDSATSFDEISVQVTDAPGGGGDQTHTGASSGNDIVIDKPTGTVTGDFLLAGFLHGGATNIDPVDVGEGWFEVIHPQSGTGGTAAELRVFGLHVTGAHSGLTSFTFSFPEGVSRGYAAWCKRYEDIDPTDPIDTAESEGGLNTASTSFTVDEVVTGFDGSYVIAFGGGFEAVGNTDATYSAVPSGYTELFDSNTLYVSRAGLCVAEQTVPVAGTVPGGSFTCTNSSQWCTAVVALKLAGAAAANDPPTVNVGADAVDHPVNTSFARTASATDPDGTIADFKWTIQSGPLGAGSIIGTAVALSWTPTAAGLYTLRGTATDDDGATAFDEMTVQVIVLPGGSGLYIWDGSGAWKQIVGYRRWDGVAWVFD